MALATSDHQGQNFVRRHVIFSAQRGVIFGLSVLGARSAKTAINSSSLTSALGLFMGDTFNMRVCVCACVCVRVCVCVWVCYVQAADIQPAFVFAHRQSFVREAAARKTEPVEKAGTKEIEITRGNATGDGSYSFFTRSQSTGLIKNYFPTKRLSGVTANSFPSRFGNFSERDVHTFLLCFSSANSLCFFFLFLFFSCFTI